MITGLTTTGTRVFQSRVYPTDTFPCLSVYTLRESSEQSSIGHNVDRTLELVVEGRAKANSDLDDTLDTIADEVETALFATPDLGVGIKYLALSDTEIELTDDLEKPAGIVRLSFNVMYRVSRTAPDVLIQ